MAIKYSAKNPFYEQRSYLNKKTKKIEKFSDYDLFAIAFSHQMKFLYGYKNDDQTQYEVDRLRREVMYNPLKFLDKSEFDLEPLDETKASKILYKD